MTIATAAAVASGIAWTVRTDEPESVAGSSASTVVNGVDGATLFRAKGCVGCHEGPDGTTGGFWGPDLSNAAEWAGDRRPGLSARDYLAESIRDPGAFTSPAFPSGGSGPVDAMPYLNVSEEEIDALIEYLLDH